MSNGVKNRINRSVFKAKPNQNRIVERELLSKNVTNVVCFAKMMHKRDRNFANFPLFVTHQLKYYQALLTLNTCEICYMHYMCNYIIPYVNRYMEVLNKILT